LTSHFSSHALPFFSPPSFHTCTTRYSFSPCSLVCGGQTSPHRSRIVESHSTCSPQSPSPHVHSFVLGTVVINNNNKHTLSAPVCQSMGIHLCSRDARAGVVPGPSSVFAAALSKQVVMVAGERQKHRNLQTYC
jgi:hypothetical protein